MQGDKINFFDFVYDAYKQMRANDINFVYEGEITHEITKALHCWRKRNWKMNKNHFLFNEKFFMLW